MGGGNPSAGISCCDQCTEDSDRSRHRSAFYHHIYTHQTGSSKKKEPVNKSRARIFHLMIDKGALCLCHNVFSRIITADKVIIIVEQIHRTICQSRNQQEKDRQWPRQTYLLLQGDNHSQQSRIDGREKNCSGSDHIDKNFPGDPPHRLRALYLHTTKPRMRMPPRRLIYSSSRNTRDFSHGYCARLASES